MVWLVLGLVVFLGAHLPMAVAIGWRGRVVAQRGLGVWKGAVAVLSLLGFALLVWGYGQARLQPVVLWVPPVATRHVAALLMLVAFVLLAATYVPRNGIKARLGHPMVLSVKVWALAHLLANGTLADVVLFGAFLAWAVLSFRAARGRDRAEALVRPAGTVVGTLATVVLGAVAWAVFAFWAHAALIGVRPFG